MLLLFWFVVVPVSVVAQCDTTIQSCVDCIGQGCFWAMNSCAGACPLGGFQCLGPGDKCPDRCDGVADPCNGRGDCNPDESQPICTCDKGWTGWSCDAPANGCLRDGDCQNNEYCDTTGVCKPKLGGVLPNGNGNSGTSTGDCQRDAQCTDGFRCVVQPRNGAICIKDAQVGDPCMRNEHCTPYYQRCVQHRCIDATTPASSCNVPGDCPGNYDNPPIMTCTNATCVYISAASDICRVDDDCYDDETCSSGRCYTNLPSCRWDGDCITTEQCRGASCINPTGRQCSTWLECQPATCAQGLCQSSYCKVDSDCPGGTICVQSSCLAIDMCGPSEGCSPGEDCRRASDAPPSARGQSNPFGRRLMQSLDRRDRIPGWNSGTTPSNPADFRWRNEHMVCRCAALSCRAHGSPCDTNRDCDPNYACRAGICLDMRFGTMWPTPGPTYGGAAQSLFFVAPFSRMITPFPTPSTVAPTRAPRPKRTPRPTHQPTFAPSLHPTRPERTERPSRKNPSRGPTRQPSSAPSPIPTSRPSSYPTLAPSALPTTRPTSFPTFSPTSVSPTARPSKKSDVTKAPTKAPTVSPTREKKKGDNDDRPTSGVPAPAAASVPTPRPGLILLPFVPPPVPQVLGGRPLMLPAVVAPSSSAPTGAPSRLKGGLLQTLAHVHLTHPSSPPPTSGKGITGIRRG